MMSGIKQLVLRVTVYIAGLLFIAFGVAFSVNSNLGISPVTALPYTLSLLFDIPLSRAIIFVYCVLIITQFFLLRKDFRMIDFTQIVFTVIIGYFTDFTKWLLGNFTLPTYWGQLAMLAISMLCISIGITLYLEAKLVPMPMEGLQLTKNWHAICFDYKHR